MATFLSLVQALARESGTLSPSLITAVTGQTNRAEKMVYWVQQAWRNIQNRRSDWGWMQTTFSAPITQGQAEYTPTALGIGSRFGTWLTDDSAWMQPISLYDPDIGVTDEGPLTQIEYLDWYHRYGRGYHDQGRPSFYSISPGKALVLGPTPDQAYTLNGIYSKSPQELATNSDVPEMPERYHDLIWMEALRLLLMRDEAYRESAWPEADYARMLSDLEREYLPEITL